MTGIKVALSCIGMVASSAASITGGIMANVPAISGDTPVNLTFALIAAGITTTAVLAWKVSRAWSQMETRAARAEERLNALENKPRG